ncbi:RHS repeat-associated core domain-containing protein [Bacteroides fragilis]
MSKRTGDTVHRFGWDGNVVLHEWDTDEALRPRLVTDETGREEYDGTEKPEGLVTWVYDGTSFTPVAKVTDGERYTIVHDYLGTPTQAYDSKGELVWEMLLDVYGKVEKCHGDRTLVPFRYQGQYEDEETGLYYNRFRYYSPDMGMYISSDPIGLAGGFNTYAYVKDTNTWVDVLGLSGELVYQLIRDNKVVYYGITSRTALERMAEHGKTKVFDNMEILADGLTHDQARSIEGALIRQRLKERADDWSDFDSIKARLDKSGLDNRNRGRIKERWTSENPLDDLRDKIYKKPKKVKVGCKS